MSVADGVDMTGSLANGANLYATRMRGARLIQTRLFGAVLRETDLRDADLESAVLTAAVLTRARLCGSSWQGAVLCDTVLADCADLHLARNLQGVKHVGASAIDYRTMRSSLVHLPLAFLSGFGIREEEFRAITSALTQIAGPAVPYGDDSTDHPAVSSPL
jgi:hypothetical protein